MLSNEIALHWDEEKGDWIVADWTVDQLKDLKDSEEPFFLACGFFLPHVPNYATQKWFDMYPEDSLTLSIDDTRVLLSALHAPMECGLAMA